MNAQEKLNNKWLLFQQCHRSRSWQACGNNEAAPKAVQGQMQELIIELDTSTYTEKVAATTRDTQDENKDIRKSSNIVLKKQKQRMRAHALSSLRNLPTQQLSKMRKYPNLQQC